MLLIHEVESCNDVICRRTQRVWPGGQVLDLEDCSLLRGQGSKPLRTLSKALIGGPLVVSGIGLLGLVEVRIRWPGHLSYQKNDVICRMIDSFFRVSSYQM